MVRTTSTNFMRGTGLKKCRPMNRSGRFVEVTSSVIEMDEVLEAKMASFFTIPSSAAYIFFFSSTFSITASMTMSQSAKSCLLVVPFSRARTACGVSLIVPFSANLASDFSMPARPWSRYFCSTSSTVTSKPAVAATCAMPEPMRPQPSTPTFLISIRLVSLSAGEPKSAKKGLRGRWLGDSCGSSRRSQADDPAQALGDGHSQRDISAVDDLGHDVYWIELLAHDGLRQPCAKRENLV